MIKILTLSVLILSLSAGILGQKADTSTPGATVDTMFRKMASFEPAAIQALYTPEAKLTAIIKRKDGSSVIKVLSGEEFSKGFAEKHGELKEDMYATEVKTYGDLSLVFGRYVFFVDGKISHCGVNAFHLVKTADGWRIVGAASTIEPMGCTDGEKARKPR